MTLNFSLAFFAAVIGAFLGKYLGWAIRAWPGHEQFHCDYLACPKCEKGIKRGCYNAGATQDKLYIVFSALVAGLSVYFFGLSVKSVISWVFAAACLIITVVDCRYLIIPDRISINGCYIGLIYAAVSSLWFYHTKTPLSYHIDFFDSLIGLAIGYGGLQILAWFALILLKKDGMGGGDIKLLGAIGAFLGWKGALTTMIIASFIGSIIGIATIIFQRIFYRKKYQPLSHMIPFGPYLCIGFLLVFYFGLEPFMKMFEAYQNWVIQ
jgi:leader peptidase (prepilin peptidase) / N-methyltransferase